MAYIPFPYEIPAGYEQLEHLALLPHGLNFWYGTTITKEEELDRIGYLPPKVNRFVSIEPMLEAIDLKSTLNKAAIQLMDWIIVGAETGNQRSKTTPERAWLENIVEAAHEVNTPVLLKDSDEIRAIWGGAPLQEFPEPLRHEDIPIPHCEGCEHHAAEFRHHDGVHGITKYNHTCSAEGAPRKVRGRDARTSPAWCPKRKRGM